MEAARAARRERRRARRSSAPRSAASSSASRRALADAEARDHRRDRESSERPATAIAAGIDARLVEGVRAVPSRANGVRRGAARRAPRARAVTSRSRPPRRSRSRSRPGSRSRTATTAARSWSPDARRGARSTSTVARAAIPGPAAIGAVVLDPSTTPPHAARRGERAHRRDHQQRRRVPGAHRRARSRAAATPRARVHVRGDSKLVIEQVAGRWKVKQPHLKPLHAQARALLDALREVDLAHVPREQNTDADALVNAALDLPLSPMFLWYIGLSVVRRGHDLPQRRHRLPADRGRARCCRSSLDIPFGYRAYGYTLLFAVGAARGRDGRHHRPAAARAPPLAVPADRRVLRARCSRARSPTTSCSGGRSSARRSPHDALLPGRGGSCSSRRSSASSSCWVLVGQYDLYLPGPRASSCAPGGCSAVELS